MSKQPSVGEIIAWLRGITAPVHGYLAASIAFRILNLSLDIALFATAAGGVAHVLATGSGAFRLLGALALLALVKGTAYYLEQYMGHHVAFKAVELLRENVYDHLWPQAPGNVARSRSGEVFATLTRDVDRIDIVYAHTIGRFVSAYVVGILSIVAAVIAVGFTPIWPVALGLFLSLCVVPYLGMRRALRATAAALDERAELAHHLTDTEFGMREVLAYGRQTDRLAELADLGRRVARSSSTARRVMGVRRAVNLVIALAATAGVLIINLEVFPLAVGAALAGGTFRAFEGARAVEDATGYFDHALAAARRLWVLSHAPAKVADGPHPLDLSGAPVVEFSGVQYAYESRGEAQLVLDGVNLEIPAGSHTVIVGRSGSGKSTLVNLLQRHDDPLSGQILLNGERVQQFTLESLRAAVVSVSQRSELLKTSIAENLRLGAWNATEQELLVALDLAGIGDEVRALPDGLDTVLGESANAFSGGQAQRISLARAMLMRPRVLILDEFTAHLNSELEEEVWSRIQENLIGTTVIEVTHRLRATSRADQIVVLEGGRIAAQGSAAEISPEHLQQMFRELRQI